MLHATLCLLPAVLLVIPLLAQRYPGERFLTALHRRKQARWPHPHSSEPARSVVLAVVRGGQLIGRSLAVRPPPASYSAS